MEPVADPEIREKIEILAAEYKDTCLWFLKEEFSTETVQDAVLILDNIEKYGDRDGFIRARRLKKWLLQNSSEPSAE